MAPNGRPHQVCAHFDLSRQARDDAPPPAAAIPETPRPLSARRAPATPRATPPPAAVIPRVPDAALDPGSKQARRRTPRPGVPRRAPSPDKGPLSAERAREEARCERPKPWQPRGVVEAEVARLERERRKLAVARPHPPRTNTLLTVHETCDFEFQSCGVWTLSLPEYRPRGPPRAPPALPRAVPTRARAQVDLLEAQRKLNLSKEPPPPLRARRAPRGEADGAEEPAPAAPRARGQAAVARGEARAAEPARARRLSSPPPFVGPCGEYKDTPPPPPSPY
jgi:hypothetical protein